MEYNQAERRRAMISKIYRKDADDDKDAGDGKGRWVTTEGGHHIHINENGEPDKGNKHVLTQLKKFEGKGPSTMALATKARLKGVNPTHPEKQDRPLSGLDKRVITKHINEKNAWVKKNLGNTYKPFEKEESVKMDKVMSRGGVDKKTAQKCVDAAEKVYAGAAKREPQITKDVVSATSRAGGEMFGLPFRMKQPTSMAGKFGYDVSGGKPLEETVKGIKDAVRYTAVFPEDNFTDGYYKVKEAMEKNGYKEVRCKNFYKMYEDGKADQRALQCVYVDKSGYPFEFQFHTVKSAGTKEVNHPVYEEWRQKNINPKRQANLSRNMRYTATHVPVPRGVLGIPSHDETK